MCPKLLVCFKQASPDRWTLKIGPELLVGCKLTLSDRVEEKASRRKCLVYYQCSCNSLGICLVIPVAVLGIRTELEFNRILCGKTSWLFILNCLPLKEKQTNRNSKEMQFQFCLFTSFRLRRFRLNHISISLQVDIVC